MLTKINHVAIAVRDMEKAIAFHKDILKLPYNGCEDVPSAGCSVAFFTCGDVEVELVTPLGTQGAVTRHLEKFGEGLYHIAYEVDSIKDSLDYFASHNLPLRKKDPMPGSRGTKVGYIEAAGAYGVTSELVEMPK